MPDPNQDSTQGVLCARPYGRLAHSPLPLGAWVQGLARKGLGLRHESLLLPLPFAPPVFLRGSPFQ
jgi:hypothetical protein